MKDRVQFAFTFDPNRMAAEVAALEKEGWIDHFVTQNYEGSWSVIPLRGPEGAGHPVQMIYSDPACDTFADTPFLNQCPYFQEVLARFACPLQTVRLMKLTAGSRIKEHIDHDLSFEQGMARLHVPITTHPEVVFMLNGKRVNMQPGECWYLRLSDPHEVNNESPVDRIHLVIDAEVNDWLRDRLAEAVV